MLTRALLSNIRSRLARNGRDTDAILAVARYWVPIPVYTKKSVYYYLERLLNFIYSTGRWGINVVSRAIANQDRFRNGKNHLLDLFIARTHMLMEVAPRSIFRDEIWAGVVNQLSATRPHHWVALGMIMVEAFPRLSTYFELIITMALVELSRVGWEPLVAKILCSPLMRYFADPDIKERLTIVTSQSRVRWDWWHRAWLRRCAAGEIHPFIPPPLELPRTTTE